MNVIKELKEYGLLSEFVYLKLESYDFKKSFINKGETYEDFLKNGESSQTIKNYIQGLQKEGKEPFTQEGKENPITEEQREDMTDIKPERIEAMLSILDKYDIKEFSSDDGLFGSDFQAMLLKNKETAQYTIAFRGTESKKDWLVDGIIASNHNVQYNEAIEFVENSIKKHNIKKEDLTLTGHSLGGILVQEVGSTLGIKGYAYNPLGSYDLVHPVFPKAFRVLEEANIYTSPMSKFANENISIISYQDTGLLNGDVLSNLATTIKGSKHLGQVIEVYGENLGFDAHSIIPSNILLEKLDKDNISSLEDINKYNQEVIEQSQSNSHSQKLKDWQEMTPEQKAQAIKNGYGLGLSSTDGIKQFEDTLNTYINDFESNKEEKLENINNLFTQINSLDTTQDKLTLLSSTDLSSSFENNYCKQFISQYQDKVISNEGNSLSSTEIFSIQINPNFNLDSFNSQEEYKPSFAQSLQNNETNNSNSNIQTMS